VTDKTPAHRDLPDLQVNRVRTESRERMAIRDNLASPETAHRLPQVLMVVVESVLTALKAHPDLLDLPALVDPRVDPARLENLAPPANPDQPDPVDPQAQLDPMANPDRRDPLEPQVLVAAKVNPDPRVVPARTEAQGQPALPAQKVPMANPVLRDLPDPLVPPAQLDLQARMAPQGHRDLPAPMPSIAPVPSEPEALLSPKSKSTPIGQEKTASREKRTITTNPSQHLLAPLTLILLHLLHPHLGNSLRQSQQQN
jgi:hypothetical protein